MLLESLLNILPNLHSKLNDHPVISNRERTWAYLSRLLRAHAPSGGSNLPGAIADDILAIAAELGLSDRVAAEVAPSGNLGLWLGAEKERPDLIIATHMDRPTFRIRSLDDGVLYPICANRFPDGTYEVGAKALRFEQGKLKVGAQGTLTSVRENGKETLQFKSTGSQLVWHDFITMDVEPKLDGDVITATGMDNCFGSLAVLLAASILKQYEDVLRANNRRCLFVFTDLEEGPPENFFGHGAARLTHTLPQPTLGCIVGDAETSGPGHMPVNGKGTSHGFASSNGRGSVVPPHYEALAVHLSEAVNAVRPGTVQMNYGYISRSDDMALSRWSRILALSGPPMQYAHTGHETGNLSDVQNGAWWLSHFLPVTLNLVPEIASEYALGR